jgi:hypothetical protein
MSKHVSTQFGLVGTKAHTTWDLLWSPFPQLQHDPKPHLISNMSGLGRDLKQDSKKHNFKSERACTRSIVHLHSWFGTLTFNILYLKHYVLQSTNFLKFQNALMPRSFLSYCFRALCPQEPLCDAGFATIEVICIPTL